MRAYCSRGAAGYCTFMEGMPSGLLVGGFSVDCASIFGRQGSPTQSKRPKLIWFGASLTSI